MIDKKPFKVFLDDTRIPSECYGDKADDEWIVVSTTKEVQELLENEVVSHLSLDNDLGEGTPEGHTLIPWMMNNMKWPTDELMVHSANPYWRSLMEQDIKHYFYGCVKPQRQRDLKKIQDDDK